MPLDADKLKQRIREITAGHESLIRSVFGDHHVPRQGQGAWDRLVNCVYNLKKERDQLRQVIADLRAEQIKAYARRRSMVAVVNRLGLDVPFGEHPWPALAEYLDKKDGQPAELQATATKSQRWRFVRRKLYDPDTPTRSMQGYYGHGTYQEALAEVERDNPCSLPGSFTLCTDPKIGYPLGDPKCPS